MRRRLWFIVILLLSGLRMYSQSQFTPTIFTAEYPSWAVSGDVRIGDIVDFGYTNTDADRGIVFYINPERTEGWVVALSDVANQTIPWAPHNNNVGSLQSFPDDEVGSLLSI